MDRPYVIYSVAINIILKLYDVRVNVLPIFNCYVDIMSISCYRLLTDEHIDTTCLSITLYLILSIFRLPSVLSLNVTHLCS